MKRFFLLIACALLLLPSCSFEPMDGIECGFCGDYYESAYCPLADGTCPSCSAKYGEECYVCGENCHYHYIEISDPLQILCYSCAEDLLNELL